MRSLAVHTRSFRTAKDLLGTSSPDDDTAAAPATAPSDEDEPPSPPPAATATVCSPAAASGLGEAMAPSAGRIDRSGRSRAATARGGVRCGAAAAAAKRKTGDRLGAAWVVVGFEMVCEPGGVGPRRRGDRDAWSPVGWHRGDRRAGPPGESEDAALMSCPRDGTGMGEARLWAGGFGPGRDDIGTGASDRIGPSSFPRTATGALLEVDLVPRLELMSGRVASSCGGIHARSMPYETKRKTQ